MRVFFPAILAMATGAVQAQPMDVAHGTDLRAELLDTFRPLAEYDLGAAVEFVVLELRVDGDHAFGRVMPQRPGGVSIDMDATPMIARRGLSPDIVDGPRAEVFFARTDGHWYVYEYVIGATDAWFWRFECDRYGSLLQEWGCAP